MLTRLRRENIAPEGNVHGGISLGSLSQQTG